MAGLTRRAALRADPEPQLHSGLRRTLVLLALCGAAVIGYTLWAQAAHAAPRVPLPGVAGSLTVAGQPVVTTVETGLGVMKAVPAVATPAAQIPTTLTVPALAPTTRSLPLTAAAGRSVVRGAVTATAPLVVLTVGSSSPLAGVTLDLGAEINLRLTVSVPADAGVAIPVIEIGAPLDVLRATGNRAAQAVGGTALVVGGGPRLAERSGSATILRPGTANVGSEAAVMPVPTIPPDPPLDAPIRAPVVTAGAGGGSHAAPEAVPATLAVPAKNTATTLQPYADRGRSRVVNPATRPG
jgi:hypothetical protein